jgi:hypothetical protein
MNRKLRNGAVTIVLHALILISASNAHATTLDNFSTADIGNYSFLGFGSIVGSNADFLVNSGNWVPNTSSSLNTREDIFTSDHQLGIGEEVSLDIKMSGSGGSMGLAFSDISNPSSRSNLQEYGYLRPNGDGTVSFPNDSKLFNAGTYYTLSVKNTGTDLVYGLFKAGSNWANSNSPLSSFSASSFGPAYPGSGNTFPYIAIISYNNNGTSGNSASATNFDSEPFTKGTLPAPNTDAYLVYSGTASLKSFSGETTVTKTESVSLSVYEVFDLAHPSNFSVMIYNPSTGYHIYTRILSADGASMSSYRDGVLDSTTDPTQNFISGLSSLPNASGVAAAGYGVLRFSITTEVDSLTINGVSNDYNKTTQIFASGALTGLSFVSDITILAVNSKPKGSGVLSVNPIITAVTNYIGIPGNAKMVSYPPKLSGQIFSYDYDPTLMTSPDPALQPLASITTEGTISLSLDTTLTSIAYVGGSYKLKGQSVATLINAISGPLTTTGSATVYDVFLYKIAKSLGLPDGYIPVP